LNKKPKQIEPNRNETVSNQIRSIGPDQIWSVFL